MFLSVRCDRVCGIWRLVHWNASMCKNWAGSEVFRTAMAIIVLCCQQSWS